MLVNFLVGGTQKGGTTALDQYLRRHPKLCMAKQKELHFFNTNSHFNCGGRDYDAYHAEFERSPVSIISGEATPAYMYWRDAPRRVWEYNPDMKWILLLRNPIERAYSHWNMACRNGWESLTFREAIDAEEARRRKTLPDQELSLSYVDRGYYTEQLRRIWEFFPRDQTLVLKTEALLNRPRQCLIHICAFLGILPHHPINAIRTHVGTYGEKLSSEDRRFLADVFQSEILSLERLLGWDCRSWLSEQPEPVGAHHNSSIG